MQAIILLLAQIILVEIVLLVSNFDKVIVRTNTFSYCLSIILSFSFSFSFIIIFSTFKILLINYIKIISIDNL